ncbi:hypothetical protein PWT90_08037 [Aphanocladium album]|nr:hypothetical protein PWT90_08037 [Aphanocladium album]
MNSTGQLSEMLWQPSYPLMLYPDLDFNDFYIPCRAPFIDAVPNTYDNKEIYHGIRYHSQCNADFLAAQEYIPAADTAGQHQRAMLHQQEPELFATAARKATHVEETLLNRNANADGNENICIDWLYPLSSRPAAQNFVNNDVPWRSDSKLDTELRGLQKNVGAKKMTEFELHFIPNDDENKEYVVESQDGDDCNLPSADSRSSQAVSAIRTAARNRVSRSRQNKSMDTYTDIPIASVKGSSTAACKATGYRKKLTIEQKRRNHIRHEKTRRGRIRDGFNDLTELIPELRGGTWSRSRILFKTVQWLQTLEERNEKLQEKLDALKIFKDYQ